MPLATVVQDGDKVSYTPNSDVSAGAVVVHRGLVGVAKIAIPANTPGSLSIEGVFDFPKATGEGTVISADSTCYWDATKQSATATPAGNMLIGKCIRTAADVDETVRIRMSPVENSATRTRSPATEDSGAPLRAGEAATRVPKKWTPPEVGGKHSLVAAI